MPNIETYMVAKLIKKMPGVLSTEIIEELGISKKQLKKAIHVLRKNRDIKVNFGAYNHSIYNPRDHFDPEAYHPRIIELGD